MIQSFLFSSKEGILIVILIVILIGSVIIDFTESKIPNLFICLGLIAGFINTILEMGSQGLLSSFAGSFLAIILLFPVFLIRGMGAGDIKLLAVTGAFFSLSDNMKCLALSIVIGACIALLKMIFYRNFRERFGYLYSYVLYHFLFRKSAKDKDYSYTKGGVSKLDYKSGIHFSLPILLAAIAIMGGAV